MRPLEEEEYEPPGPPRSERIFVGCFAFVVCLVIFVVAVGYAFQHACACTVHTTAAVGRTVDIPGNLDIRLIGYTVSAHPSGSGDLAGLQFAITHWTVRNPGKQPVKLARIEAVSGLHTLGPADTGAPIRNTLPREALPPGVTVKAAAAFLIERHAKAALIYRVRNYVITWPIVH